MDYGFPRGVGHTYTELNGVKNNPNSALVVADYQQGRQLGLKPDQIITISQIPEKLRGIRRAVVIDHFALTILLEEHNRLLNQPN